MHSELTGLGSTLLLADFLSWLSGSYLFLKVLIGFSLVIFVHELGHFLAAKWMGIRVDRFAIGFFYRLGGWRRGEGLTFGPHRGYTTEELAEKGYGETDYCFNAFPFGGYVKMLGEDDILVDEETGEVSHTDDPRSFTNKSVGRRLVVVSAGVIFNLAFAVLAYSLVYLSVGRQAIAPVIGMIAPGTSAARSGLLPGDRVVEINGQPVKSYSDIVKARLLADKDDPPHFKVERGGQLLDEDLIVGWESKKAGEFPSDIIFMPTTKVGPVVGPQDDDQGLRAGDVVTAADGRPVDNATEIVVAVGQCRGQPVELTVERPDSEDSESSSTVTVVCEPSLELTPAWSLGAADQRGVFVKHLLGFQRRQKIAFVAEGSPAQRAGIQVGDVIAQWGSVASPLYHEIVAITVENNRMPVPVVVERAGEVVELTVVPKSDFALFAAPPPKAGVSFEGEVARAVVADVVPGTPAASLGVPRGAVLLAIDGRATASWFEVLEALRDSAGKAVELRYRSGDDEVVASIEVPSSLVNELSLPPTARVTRIDGEGSVALEAGRVVHLPDALAVRELLRARVGQTVTVEYARDELDVAIESAEFAVSANNVDPWQMRANYGFKDALSFLPLTEWVTAGGNPLVALSMGTRNAYRDLTEVFLVVKGMIKNTVTQKSNISMKNVSGPVGIVRVAMRYAEAGLAELLCFLALISANLAVINMIPLPVVDGGQVLFLTIEKIRGKTLSIKVQVITTLAGLTLIAGMFLFVTFQDIVKWVNSG